MRGSKNCVQWIGLFIWLRRRFRMILLQNDAQSCGSGSQKNCKRKFGKVAHILETYGTISILNTYKLLEMSAKNWRECAPDQTLSYSRETFLWAVVVPCRSFPPRGNSAQISGLEGAAARRFPVDAKLFHRSKKRVIFTTGSILSSYKQPMMTKLSVKG